MGKHVRKRIHRSFPWFESPHSGECLRQQFEGSTGWSDDREVAAVERGDLSDPETFGSCDHRGVHRPERKVAVDTDEFGDPKPVGRRYRLWDEASRSEVADEPDFGADAEPCPKEVDDLGDDELGDDERSLVGLEKLQAVDVPSVVAVDVGVQRTGVAEQRDSGISKARISSMRSEMSEWPLAPAPAAKNERRAPPRWASIASRVSSDTVVPRRSAS